MMTRRPAGEPDDITTCLAPVGTEFLERREGIVAFDDNLDGVSLKPERRHVLTVLTTAVPATTTVGAANAVRSILEF